MGQYGMNLLLNTDSYKASHYLQYPANTQFLSSYIEARGGEFKDVVFFGLQAFMIEYLTKPFSYEDIQEANKFFLAHGLPFNQIGWEYILKKYDGYLPLTIEALAEGSIVPVSQVLMQVVNSDPKCFWLTSYIETAMLRAIWYPSTVATVSYECKKIIGKYLLETSGSLKGLEYKLHDFGARGASSYETASLGGMAHLVNFKGSDTVSGILAAAKYYNEPMAAYSIPATEHSVITSFGKEHEAEAYRHILKVAGGAGKFVAVVSDSYDLWYAIEKIWGEQLKAEVQKNGGTVVIRPDSGDPIAVVTRAIEILMQKFGYETNKQGYKVLPPYIRVIQGDGISLDSINDILYEMKKRKQCVQNVAFGMGASLLQKVNRDTMRFAMKASAICRDNVWLDIAKTPLTDVQKTSKPGRLALIKNAQNQYETIHYEELAGRENQLKPIYKNGKILNYLSFSQVRDNMHFSESVL